MPTEELNDGLAAIPGLLVRLVEDGPIKRVALRRQIEEYPLEQAGYFIAAAAFWSREEVEEACRVLRAGREATRSTTLLYPPWLACCK